MRVSRPGLIVFLSLVTTILCPRHQQNPGYKICKATLLWKSCDTGMETVIGGSWRLVVWPDWLLSSSELIFKRFLNISQSLQRDRGVIMSISVLMSDFLRLVSLLCSVEVKLCPSGVNLLQTSINYEMI